MARATVFRFYDDATAKPTQRGSRRSPKRIPDYEPSPGVLGYASKRRTGVAASISLHRGAAFQAVALLLVLALLIHPAFDRSDTLRRLGSTAAAARYFASSRSLGGVRVNVPPEMVHDGVSLVAVCMGRASTVNKTARAWLNVKKVDEIVLVDWSSEPPLEPIVRSIPGGDRIKIIRVDGEKSWVLSRAYNLAVNASSYSNIIRTDCDYAVNEDFVEAHKGLLDRSAHTVRVEEGTHLLKKSGHYYAGNYKLARNENEVHLNGAVFIRRKDFLDVGGYDERIQTYGWDDEDLYDRLGASGLQKRNVSYDHVQHVQHGNEGRAQTGVKFVGVEIDLNSLLVAKLPKWNARMRPSIYRVNPRVGPGANSPSAPTRSNRHNFISISAVTRPRSLRELVDNDVYVKSWDLALGRRLHDSYFVPWDIIGALSLGHKELLLRRLMTRSENRERLAREELNAAGRQNEMVDANKIPSPRIFVCHCMHGLGNRLRALASCMSFAKETSRELVVIWEPDSHIAARLPELFESPLVVIEKFPVHWPFAGVEKWDSVWSQFKFHNYMEMERQGAIKGETVVNLPDKHMYYKGAYIIEAANRALTNWEKDNESLRSLIPVKEVTEKLGELVNRGLGRDNIIGMHIRNRTLEKDIKNVDFVKEYGDGPTATMDMWRRKSGVHTFISQIRLLLQQQPNVKFFVATDTFEVIGQLENMFGPERIMSVKRSCDDRDSACVRFALVDMYALAKCKSLYGSNWSSFTEVAQRLGGQKALLAGVDFGVAKR